MLVESNRKEAQAPEFSEGRKNPAIFHSKFYRCAVGTTAAGGHGFAAEAPSESRVPAKGNADGFSSPELFPADIVFPGQPPGASVVCTCG